MALHVVLPVHGTALRRLAQLLGEHPEKDGERLYGYGCAWYADNGPFFSGLQFAWWGIGAPCIVVTFLALLSACGLTCFRWCRGPGTPQHVSSPTSPTSAEFSSLYGPLIDVSDVHLDVDGDVHKWVGRGAASAIVYGVLLAVLAVFIALHANNEVKFSFVVDAIVAMFMCASKVMVTICARTVHRHLSPLSRQVAQKWVKVLALSKALTAMCALVLAVVYTVLAFTGVDVNQGDGTRRLADEYTNVDYTNATGEDDSHAPTPEEQAQLCGAAFFMVWSFLLTLLSQSIAAFAFFRIYVNAVNFFGDPFVFHKVVNCGWGMLVVCTCAVGIAMWLGAGICIFPALDISPLRMMGLFYFGAAVSQMLAGSAMLLCNHRIRKYWAGYKHTIELPGPTVLGHEGSL